jgi:phosphatidate cytidylyltransferase
LKDITKRILAALCLAPPVAAVFYFVPPPWFFLFISFVSILAVFELVMMADLQERWLLIFLTGLSLMPLYQKSFQIYLLWLLFAPLIYLIGQLVRGESIKKDNVNADILRGVMVLISGAIFVIIPLWYLHQLRELGRSFPLALLLSLWGSDTCAYLFGKALGKNPLVPRISPKKTYEGLFGAVIGSMLVMLLLRNFTNMNTLEAGFLGIMIGLLGQMGDIFESVGKRVCAVKDSSSMIPGHGGILDRMDSFIFAAPFFYHYLSGIKSVVGGIRV